MSGVYSTMFLSQHGVASGTVLDLPNPGPDIWIVRDIDAFFATIGPNTMSVFDETGSTFFSETQVTAPNGAWFQWRGRQVFLPGDHIKVSVTTDVPEGGLDIRISGYVLSPD